MKTKDKKERKPRAERKPNACHTSTGRLKNWQEYTATVEDIKTFLDDRVMLRYNVVTRRTECHQPRYAKFYSAQAVRHIVHFLGEP